MKFTTLEPARSHRLSGLLSDLASLPPRDAGVVTVTLSLRREFVDAVSEIAASAQTPFEVIVETFAEVGLISHQRMEANREELNAS